MDMSKYRGIFLSETKEHFRKMSQIVLSFEGGGSDGESIDALFREAHSVKGMAASMGYAQMERLAHHLESVLDRFRTTGTVSDDEADTLLAGIDLLEELLHDIEAERPERDIAHLLSPSTEAFQVQPSSPKGSAATPEREEEEEFRFRRDDSLRTVRVQTSVLDRFIDLAGELITTRHMLQSASEARDWESLQHIVEEQGRLIGDLHNQVRQVRLMPLESLMGRLPRLVRDLARRTGKEVRVQIEGEELELDRSILEALADPLVHLVRNAVDHGIEKCGTVSVRAWRDKDQAIIEVADDGRGIDPRLVLQKALEKGLITPAQASSLQRRDALQLICTPGLSTARGVTQTSGRGVGMDVVKSALEGIGGRLEIDSRQGRGTRFRLQLPMSAAIIHLLLVDCGPERLGIPFTRVQRILELSPKQVLLRRGKGTSFIYEEEEIPLLSLNRILGLGRSRPQAEALPVVLTEIRGRRVGLAVDHITGTRQAFVKGLAFPLDQLQGVSGSTVLGDGRIVFIADPQRLLENRRCSDGSNEIAAPSAT